MFPYTPADAKSFSQKVARFFEVVDYLLLAPATFGLMLALTVSNFAPWFTLSIITAFVGGCYLLSGFFRHSRGRLSDSKVSFLWCATIVYNSIDLIVTLLIAGESRDKFSYVFALWPLVVILLSALALASENRRVKLTS
jgi:hypothetical protein